MRLYRKSFFMTFTLSTDTCERSECGILTLLRQPHPDNPLQGVAAARGKQPRGNPTASFGEAPTGNRVIQ
jgi:hypothetical protein